MPVLDNVRDLSGPNRLPDGLDEKAFLRAEEHLAINTNAQIELGSHAGYIAAHKGEIDEQHRRDIAGVYHPEFDTIIWPVVYGESPVSYRPNLKIGWVLGSITLYPPVKTDFTIPPNLILLLQGMDEVSAQYIPFGSAPANIKMRRRLYGTIAIQMSVIGTNPGALLCPPMVEFQMERWTAGRPMGED